MKKFKILVFMLILLNPVNIIARQGCCSRHGGVAGCTSYGKTICSDGTLSPTCTCTPPAVYGCTDSKATNYNRNATKDDGSCKYTLKGCIDKKAINYDSKANTADGSCLYEKIEVLEEVIPFEMKYENIDDVSEIEVDSSQFEEIIVQEGSDGLKKITKKTVTDEKDKEILKEILGEEIVVEPITKIVRIMEKEAPISDEKDEDMDSKPEEDKHKNDENDKDIVNNKSVEKEKNEVAYIMYCILALALLFKKHTSDTIVNKIKIKKNNFWKPILYFLYFATVIPVVIDIVIIVKEYMKKLTAIKDF